MLTRRLPHGSRICRFAPFAARFRIGDAVREWSWTDRARACRRLLATGRRRLPRP